MPISDDDLSDLNDDGLRYIAITMQQLMTAQAKIASCESCNPEAGMPFDWLLRDVLNGTGDEDYVIPQCAICPGCGAAVHEKTLIEASGFEPYSKS